MVDIGVGEVTPPILAYCGAKCAAEHLDRRLRGQTGSRPEERRKYISCFATCISPVDLPSRTDDEATGDVESEAEVAGDDDDDDDD